jgi:hypothetical protein
MLRVLCVGARNLRVLVAKPWLKQSLPLQSALIAKSSACRLSVCRCRNLRLNVVIMTNFSIGTNINTPPPPLAFPLRFYLPPPRSPTTSPLPPRTISQSPTTSSPYYKYLNPPPHFSPRSPTNPYFLPSPTTSLAPPSPDLPQHLYSTPFNLRLNMYILSRRSTSFPPHYISVPLALPTTSLL